MRIHDLRTKRMQAFIDGQYADRWDEEPVQRLHGDIERATCAAFSPDAHFVAVAGDDMIGIWELSSNKQIALLELAETEFAVTNVTCMDFSPDGEKLLAGDDEGSIALFTPKALRQRP